jgi:hypothetical protein
MLLVCACHLLDVACFVSRIALLQPQQPQLRVTSRQACAEERLKVDNLGAAAVAGWDVLRARFRHARDFEGWKLEDDLARNQTITAQKEAAAW